MTYKVALVHSDEGYTITCPELPGCITEGDTAEEAMTNMQDAIRDYLEVVTEMSGKPVRLGVEIRDLQVA